MIVQKLSLQAFIEYLRGFSGREISIEAGTLVVSHDGVVLVAETDEDNDIVVLVYLQ